MKGVPVSASSPDIKQLLGEPSIPPVGNLSVEQWSKAPTRPLIRWPDQSAVLRIFSRFVVQHRLVWLILCLSDEYHSRFEAGGQMLE
jgi:hypothetical protein